MVSGMTRLLVFLLVTMLVATRSAATVQTVRIMPVGDSITVGATSLEGAPYYQPHVPFEYGYRADLYTLLTQAGYPSFQFVGSSPQGLVASSDATCVDLAALGQQNHNGYGGQGVNFIASNIVNWMRQDNPDIILLMIGINDIGQGSVGAPTALENRLAALAQTVATVKPSAHLIIAQTIPYATGYTDSLVQYNNYIKSTLVPTLAAQGKLVTTVDQYSPFLTDGQIDSSLYSNAINHPSAVGYERMAQNWFNGIMGLGTVVHTPLPDVVIHAITDANLLSGKPVVASSLYNESFSPSYATDGTTNDQVFSDGDVGRMVVHGIGSRMGVIRIWQDLADGNRIPSRVIIRSSASDTTSLDPASFETSLADLTTLLFNAEGYVDVRVNAPANTQSLFFDFGSVDSLGQPYGLRIAEVQAFLVPEPPAIAALVAGLIAVVAARGWRQRNKRVCGIGKMDCSKWIFAKQEH